MVDVDRADLGSVSTSTKKHRKIQADVEAPACHPIPQDTEVEDYEFEAIVDYSVKLSGG